MYAFMELKRLSARIQYGSHIAIIFYYGSKSKEIRSKFRPGVLMILSMLSGGLGRPGVLTLVTPDIFLEPGCTSKGNIKIVLWVCSLGKAPMEYQTWCENTVLGPKVIKLCFRLESMLTHIQLNAFGQIRTLYPLTTIDEMLSEGIQSIS